MDVVKVLVLFLSMLPFITIVCAWLYTAQAKEQDIVIGSFNVKRLGKKKLSDPFARDLLIKIMQRYDLLLLIEVQDAKMKYIPGFIDSLTKTSGKSYKYVISDLLGRTTYKEQYLFIYRSDLFDVAGSYHFDDGDEEKGDDLFEREPFIVKFVTHHMEPNEFSIVAVHTPPSEAAVELSGLIHVYDDAIKRLKTHHVVIMGDFNAACRYVRKSDWDGFDIHRLDKFHWLIPHNEDTTVGISDCAYDRIVVSGSTFMSNIVEGSTRAFRFDDYFSLTMEDANRVSDHYPVEFKIQRRVQEGVSERRGKEGL